MPLSDKVKVTSDSGIHWRCWRAAAPIKTGEKIWWAGEWDDKDDLKVPLTEFNTWPKEKQDKFMELAYQIDDHTLSGFPEGKDIPQHVLDENYVNHSCGGNVWFEGDRVISALRDIEVDEEIAYDYALTEAGEHFLIPNCRCGTSSCRGKITGNDWSLPELQAKYGDHFLPHILAKINAAKGGQN